MDKKLQLVFFTDNNKTYTINIDNPLEPLDNVKIKACMDNIIATNIIQTKNGALVSIKGAYLVTKTVDEVTLV